MATSKVATKTKKLSMEVEHFRMKKCVWTEIKMIVRCKRTHRSALKIPQALFIHFRIVG